MYTYIHTYVHIYIHIHIYIYICVVAPPTLPPGHRRGPRRRHAWTASAGAKDCTPEINTSDIIMVFQWILQWNCTVVISGVIFWTASAPRAPLAARRDGCAPSADRESPDRRISPAEIPFAERPFAGIPSAGIPSAEIPSAEIPCTEKLNHGISCRIILYHGI